ncbi:hypothetical protein AB0E63_42770 [Kribbella sp. NPDC026596]|uniref:hypothetical protein n=1 Tax=Kribbella sp. NPDC026596 TaxID=3155122 RepID=UPI0033E4BC38
MSTPVRTLDIAGGSAMGEPGPHSGNVDGDHHLGLQDASCHDQDSIDPTQPLRRELTLGLGVVVNLQAYLHGLVGAVLIQYDICKDLRATQAGASMQLQLAKADVDRANANLESAVARLPSDRPDLLADSQAEAPPSRSSWAGFARAWFAIAVFGVLEIITNHLAMLYLRDDDWATWVLAGATSAAILGGCFYIAQSTSRLRTSALGLCVTAVVVGSGMMRYRYAADRVSQGLADHDLPPMGATTKLAILAFAIGLPAAFGLITIAKTRPEPGAAEAAATRSAEVRLVGGVRRLHEIAERRRTDVRAAVEAESSAVDALRNGEAALHRLCDQTEASIMAEYGRRFERLDAYFRGLALGAKDPGMTTRLDRRYAEAVKSLADQLAFAVQEARKQIASVRADLLAFPATEPAGES